MRWAYNPQVAKPPAAFPRGKRTWSKPRGHAAGVAQMCQFSCATTRLTTAKLAFGVSRQSTYAELMTAEGPEDILLPNGNRLTEELAAEAGERAVEQAAAELLRLRAAA